MGIIAPPSYKDIAIRVGREVRLTFDKYSQRLLVQNVNDGGE